MRLFNKLPILALALSCVLQAQVSLTTPGTAYTPNFDSLASSGTANTVLSTGWALLETGTSALNNSAYSGGTGSSNSVAISPGVATGIARIVHTPSQAAHLAPGDILVAPSTDPGWTPLFLRASAIVMEAGGFLSHGAIVAREYGLPAVANVPGILSVLKDGERITVDGSAGRVIRNAPRP